MQHITVFFQEKTQVLSYEIYGQALHSAPIVLVNHALTGNSTICGEDGWWKDLIGEDKAINTNKYTIVAFNIPGNGFDGVLINNYKSFSVKDIAQLFLKGLEILKVNKLFAIIGGSLGGGIAWQMATLQPNITKHLIPVATHHLSSDWIIANCLIQEQFLLNSSKPIHDARLHAMLCYRTPESFKDRFNRSINKELNVFNIESWLLHHGKKLQERFQLSAYKVMNQLLRTISVTDLTKIEAEVTLVGINTDLFFTVKDIKESYLILQKLNKKVSYNEIKSIHGHDAFLIEYNQLTKILQPIFN
ncbi:alpha/beta fold hydrolase [Aurantibacter sp.]|uniref:alpha/beta fold hydrolase n=1 Tax=Aurantibacter sp. TaxID=2807103 RepID=UPI0035C86D04